MFCRPGTKTFRAGAISPPMRLPARLAGPRWAPTAFWRALDTMRFLAFVTAMFVAASAAGLAQAAPTKPDAPPPSAPPPTPPRAFLAEGYSQPDITPGLCKAIDAQRTACTIPGMTAGTYYAEAVGASTATAEGAAQQLTIVAGDQSCTATHGKDPKAPWAVGTQRSLRGGCIFTIVTDSPVNVVAIYADTKATKDPKGPALAVRRMPWSGVLNSVPVREKQ